MPRAPRHEALSDPDHAAPHPLRQGSAVRSRPCGPGFPPSACVRDRTPFVHCLRTLVVPVLCLSLSGCDHAPSRNILGSFFPAWMLCALCGILASLAVRQIVVRAGVDAFVPAKLLVYAGLAVSLTFLLWLWWFGN